MKKFKFFILNLFLLCSSFLFSSENIVTISLGPNCIPALFLRHYNLRTEAYPFDWVICYYPQMYKLIETDFEDYMLKENLIIDPIDPRFVNDIKTGVKYTHDFPLKHDNTKSLQHQEQQDTGRMGEIAENFLDSYEAIYKKYQRRIERFKTTCLSDKYVLFFCFNIGKHQAVSLRDLLTIKYPCLNFKIIAVNNGPKKNSKSWSEVNIENYSSENNFWDVNGSDWKEIFQDLNLIPFDTTN